MKTASKDEMSRSRIMTAELVLVSFLGSSADPAALYATSVFRFRGGAFPQARRFSAGRHWLATQSKCCEIITATVEAKPSIAVCTLACSATCRTGRIESDPPPFELSSRLFAADGDYDAGHVTRRSRIKPTSSARAAEAARQRAGSRQTTAAADRDSSCRCRHWLSRPFRKSAPPCRVVLVTARAGVKYL